MPFRGVVRRWKGYGSFSIVSLKIALREGTLTIPPFKSFCFKGKTINRKSGKWEQELKRRGHMMRSLLFPKMEALKEPWALGTISLFGAHGALGTIKNKKALYLHFLSLSPVSFFRA